MSKLKALILCLFIFWAQTIKAAGPIVHILLANEWLEQLGTHYDAEQRQAFLIGTLFPDIRYLGVLKRSQTHFKKVTLAQIAKIKSPFEQGMLFHSFVDEKRNKIVYEHKMREKLKALPRNERNTFLKLVEDDILFYEAKWDEIRKALLSILPEEKSFQVNYSDLAQWHFALILYFNSPPQQFISQLGLIDFKFFKFNPSSLQLWHNYLENYAKEAVFKRYVTTLIQSFKNDIKKFKLNKK